MAKGLPPKRRGSDWMRRAKLDRCSLLCVVWSGLSGSGLCLAFAIIIPPFLKRVTYVSMTAGTAKFRDCRYCKIPGLPVLQNSGTAGTANSRCIRSVDSTDWKDVSDKPNAMSVPYQLSILG